MVRIRYRNSVLQRVYLCLSVLFTFMQEAAAGFKAKFNKHLKYHHPTVTRLVGGPIISHYNVFRQTQWHRINLHLWSIRIGLHRSLYRAWWPVSQRGLNTAGHWLWQCNRHLNILLTTDWSKSLSGWIQSKEEVSDCFPLLKFFLLLINSNQLSHNPKTQTDVIPLIFHLNNKPLHRAGLQNGAALGVSGGG